MNMNTIVQQDIGMTPAPIELDDGEEEGEEGEEDEGGEQLLFEDGQEYGNDDEEELADGQPNALTYEEDEERDEEEAGNIAYTHSSGADAMEDEDDPDAELDEMDPSEMDEEEQIRYLQRQHAREMLAQQTSQRIRASESAADADEDDFFDHVTPPSRSHRTVPSSTIGLVTPSTNFNVAPSAPRSISTVARVVTPPTRTTEPHSTVRRTLDLDSSNDDSNMQIDTPPRTNPSRVHDGSTPDEGDHLPISASMLAELGLPAEEVEAILAEQRIIYSPR